MSSIRRFLVGAPARPNPSASPTFGPAEAEAALAHLLAPQRDPARVAELRASLAAEASSIQGVREAFEFWAGLGLLPGRWGEGDFPMLLDIGEASGMLPDEEGAEAAVALAASYVAVERACELARELIEALSVWNVYRNEPKPKQGSRALFVAAPEESVLGIWRERAMGQGVGRRDPRLNPEMYLSIGWYGSMMRQLRRSIRRESVWSWTPTVSRSPRIQTVCRDVLRPAMAWSVLSAAGALYSPENGASSVPWAQLKNPFAILASLVELGFSVESVDAYDSEVWVVVPTIGL